MRQKMCDTCKGVFPVNDLLLLDEKRYCYSCLEQRLDELKNSDVVLEEDAVSREPDPTVCMQCNKDNGEEELGVIAGLPFCPECAEYVRHRPFPKWLKVSFTMVMILAIVVFVRNWRFFSGYYQMNRALVSMKNKKVKLAMENISRAASNIPESRDIATYKNFVFGVNYLQKHRYGEAVPFLLRYYRDVPESGKRPALQHLLFAQIMDLLGKDGSTKALDLAREYRQKFPGDDLGKILLLMSEIGDAFDRKDYDTFLRLSLENEKINPDSSTAIAQVASAYACKYATTGLMNFRTLSMNYLEKAGKKARVEGSLKAFREYADRIRHRLNSRRIISKKEYDKLHRRSGKGQ